MMSMINPKLKKLIMRKLEDDLCSKEIVPNGRTLWILDSEKQDWFINVTCNGVMEFNSSLSKQYSDLFSIENRVFSNVLKEWFEKKFEVRINNSQRRTPNLQYLVEDALKSKNGKWELGERYGFSYDFVKTYLLIQKQNKKVLVEDFFISL